jgi:HD-GYP domain-containing protein (c-di-GMP phosphodiesterase class II)
MDRALILSNYRAINSLYQVNLRAYVELEADVVPKPLMCLTALEDYAKYRTFIVHNDGYEAVELETIIEQVSARIKGITVIVMGSGDDIDMSGLHILPNRYDIKNMLRTIAKALDISAAEMARRDVGEYFPIPIDLVAMMSRTNCEIFSADQVSKSHREFVQILEKDELIMDQIMDLKEKNHDFVYVKADERLKFINKASTILIDELDREDLSGSEKLAIVSSAQTAVAEEMFEKEEINEELASISKSCISSIKDVMDKTPAPQLQNLLKALLDSKSGYVYQHGILATFIATKIIEQISWGTKEQAEKVAFALFFHDIYLLPIYKKFPDAVSEEDLLFRDDLSEDEKQLVIEHAKLAGGVLKTYPRAPIGADMIVAQHHGMVSGEGFAVNYKDDISPLARIIVVSEEIGTHALNNQKAGKKGKDLIDRERLKVQLYDRYRTTQFKKVIDAFMKVEL